MHTSSETIGALAAALAKAQGEITNPEKALTAVIPSPFPREDARTFRYASLASGLDSVRKALSQYEIATLQTTRIDQDAGHVQLTTILAHSSGEWISSEWPVCPVSETAAPHRMGAALTYARRYALFALVGIAGEDDLDAPSAMRTSMGPIEPPLARMNEFVKEPRSNSGRATKTLAPEDSLRLRHELIEEISHLSTGEELALWAHKRLASKNALTVEDAIEVEAAYSTLLQKDTRETSQEVEAGQLKHSPEEQISRSTTMPEPMNQEGNPAITAELVTPLRKEIRQRNKAHLLFVGAQPCLVCKRTPCDAHHLKFSQPKALGRKVSDEFTVPLCRDHHTDLHNQPNERSWWANTQIDPMLVAKELWQQTSSRGP